MASESSSFLGQSPVLILDGDSDADEKIRQAIDCLTYPLGDLLYVILQSHPEGIKEFDLVTILKKGDIPYFSIPDLSDSLALFRTHFLLFHTLYRLRQRLRTEENLNIHIHCLRIVLERWEHTESTFLPAPTDPLESYYLDLTHFYATNRDQVEKMLSWFWQHYDKREHRSEALAVLGLEDPVSDLEIKKKFRELAHKHHPDHGGDPACFRAIMEAMTTLSSTPIPS